MGVGLEDGNRIYSNTVISAIGIKETLFKLVPEQERPPEPLKTLATHVSVPSFLLLLVGFEGDISSFGIKRSAYKTIIGDPSTMSRNPTEEGWICDDVTVSFPSLLDRDYKNPSFQTAEIHHETRFEYFEKYEGKQGDDEYLQIMDRITRHFLNHIDERFPGLGKHVRYSKLITATGHKKDDAPR